MTTFDLNPRSPSSPYKIIIDTVTPGETGYQGTEPYMKEGWSRIQTYYNADGTIKTTGTQDNTTTSWLQIQNHILNGECWRLEVKAPLTEHLSRYMLGNAITDYIISKIPSAFGVTLPVEPDPYAPIEASVEYTFEVQFWWAIPSSWSNTILTELVKYEDKFGWHFWTCGIYGDTIQVKATKEGSVTIALVCATIIAVVAAIVGVFAIRSWRIVEESRELTKRTLSDERQGLIEFKEQVLKSDLPPEEKARQLAEADKQIANTTPSDSNGGINLDSALDKILIVALIAAAASMLKN